ncbi:Aspartic protease 6 [Aphelenchoides fujianensis]|nr:Aspartic protease 6 [Aphelenchoides fujianensis]
MAAVNSLLSFFLCSFLLSAVVGNKVIPQPFYNRNNAGVWTGTPSQWLQVRLDTEASQVFFISKDCTTPGCTKNRVGYDSSASSTFHEFFWIPYSTYYLGTEQKGRLFLEKLTGLGDPIGPIYFPLVTQTSGELTEGVGAGVAGVGFSDGLTLLPNLRIVTSLIGEQMTAWHLDVMNYTKATGLQGAGYGVFGGNEETGCKSDIVWHNVTLEKRWVLTLQKIQFGSKSFTTSMALVRPGPFKIYGPKVDIKTIFQELYAKKDGEEWYVDCSKQASMPNFEFTIDGKKHTIKPSQYLAQSLDDSSKCIVLFGINEPKYGDMSWVLGDVIFREQCILMHIANQAIGFVGRK